ncbi:MAG: hypothetical protein NT023_16920 [Armatimonadetes bacterium]|nr:hypothetical protein [Armatimonadota bacterium]
MPEPEEAHPALFCRKPATNSQGDVMYILPLPRYLMLSAIAFACVFTASPSLGQKSAEEKPAPLRHLMALRLGTNLVHLGPAFGLDFTLPGAIIAPGFSTRFTLESILFSRRDGLLSSLDPIGAYTLEQVYQNPRGGSKQPYFGFGLGIYNGPLGEQSGSTVLGPTFQNVSAFGAKLFLGTDITSTTSVEFALHTTRQTTLLTLQVRLRL